MLQDKVSAFAEAEEVVVDSKPTREAVRPEIVRAEQQQQRVCPFQGIKNEQAALQQCQL